MKYFNGIVCGSEVEHGKPAPDIFLKACDKLNVDEISSRKISKKS